MNEGLVSANPMREELEQLMMLYVVGLADESETARVEEWLASGDPVAQAVYAEASAVVHSLPQALPMRSPPRRVRDQLMLRVLASTQQPIQKTDSRKWGTWVTWSAGGLAAVLAIATVGLWQINRQTQSQLAMEMEQESRTNRLVASPYVRLAKLQAESFPGLPMTDPIRQAGGGLMYCAASNQFQLRIAKLCPPPPGRVYELWLISSTGEKIPAGTFVPDPNGTVTHFFQAPQGVEFEIAAITDEPPGGSPTPTGQIRLKGPLKIRDP